MPTIKLKMRCAAVTARADKTFITMLEATTPEEGATVEVSGGSRLVLRSGANAPAFRPGDEYEIGVTVTA